MKKRFKTVLVKLTAEILVVCLYLPFASGAATTMAAGIEESETETEDVPTYSVDNPGNNQESVPETGNGKTDEEKRNDKHPKYDEIGPDVKTNNWNYYWYLLTPGAAPGDCGNAASSS